MNTILGQTDVEEAVIVMTRTLNAPRKIVFAAWTDPKRVAEWWKPEGFEITKCVIDLKVGGAFNLFMRAPDGAEYACKGEYLEIDPPSRLVYFGDPACEHPCGAGLPPKARVTVTFEDEGDKTRLKLHTLFTSQEALEAANAGGYSESWGGTLDMFEHYIQETD